MVQNFRQPAPRAPNPNPELAPQKIKCKRCGSLTFVNDFKLDTEAQQLVCGMCISGKSREIPMPVRQITKPAAPKPQIIVRAREQKSVGGDIVERACTNCGYKFKYDYKTGKPGTCPYCDRSLKFSEILSE